MNDAQAKWWHCSFKMKPSIFKAYDIRGRYPREINKPVVFAITRALVASFAKKKRSVRVVVGHDARNSSEALYLVALRACGSDPRPKKVYAAGLITTPTLYLLVNLLSADGGLMITASHDPKNYNGIKMVGPKAVPLSGTDAYKIVSRFSKLH